MGKRDVTTYTCDGCRASSTVGIGEQVRGFTRVLFVDKEYWVCTICYGAIEWIVKFQNITHPPRVFVNDGKYALRKKS